MNWRFLNTHTDYGSFVLTSLLSSVTSEMVLRIEIDIEIVEISDVSEICRLLVIRLLELKYAEMTVF